MPSARLPGEVEVPESMTSPQARLEIAAGAPCPVCGSGETPVLERAENWGYWHMCGSCTLEFVQPLELPEEPEQLYDSAYRGERFESRMKEFNDRLRQRNALIDVDPTLWFWSPAFFEIIDWLKSRVGREARVFEIGCGLGFMLHAMRREGLDVAGLDVAEKAVELNRADGFRVWHGQVETVPLDWTDPDAIVCMFMLHHVLDPVSFLSTIRARWPRAAMAIAQYGPSNKDALASQPPRTLTRWSAPALEAALGRSGYRSSIRELASTGNESPLLRPIRKVLKQSIRVPAVYRGFRRIEHRFVRRVVHRAGRAGYVVLAFAEPDI